MKRRTLYKRLAFWKKEHRGCVHRNTAINNPCSWCCGIKELEEKLETVTCGLGTAWKDISLD
jgi:hypothetical protein